MLTDRQTNEAFENLVPLASLPHKMEPWELGTTGGRRWMSVRDDLSGESSCWKETSAQPTDR